MQVKGKGTKKSVKITLIVIASLITLLITPIILLNFNGIQNFLVKKITDSVSKTLNAEVHIGHVDLHLFGTLSFQDIQMIAPNGDTLLRANELNARLNPMELRNGSLHFTNAELLEPNIKLRIDTNGNANFAFLTELFPDSAQKQPLDFRFDCIKLQNATFAFKNEQKTEKPQSNFNANDIKINNLNLLANFSMTRDKKIDANLEKLNFNEQSGFELKNLQAAIEKNDSIFKIPKFNIDLAQSHISFDTISATYSDLKEFAKHADSLQIDATLKKSTIYFPDLKAFVSDFGNIRNKLVVSGNLSGTLNNLKAKDLRARYGQNILFNGDFHFKGLPNVRQTSIDAQLNEISFTTDALQDVIAQIAKRPITLPAEILQLGKCRYSGKVTGTLNNAKLNGQLNTNAGTIKTDVELQANNDLTDIKLNGFVSSNRIQLGMITPKNIGIGNITFDAHADLHLQKNKPLKVNSDMNIASVTFKNHTYENIKIKGDYFNKSFAGIINIDDEHLQFDFDGKVDWNQEQYIFNFDADVAEFQPYKLNLIKNNPELKISTHINSRFEGPDADNMVGHIRLNNTFLDNESDFFMQEMLLTSTIDKTHDITLQSDFINGFFKGKYTFIALVKSCKQLVQHYFPILNNGEQIANLNLGNKVFFHFDIGNTEALTNALNIAWFTPEISTINGHYNDEIEDFVVSVSVPQISNRKNGHYEGIGIDIDNRRKRLNCMIEGKVITRLNDTIKCQASLSGRNDSLTTHLQWENTRTLLTHAGEVLFHSYFFKENERTNAKFQILPTQIILQNTPFDLHAGEISTNFEKINIKQLNIDSERQHIYIDGTASKSEFDSIYVNLQNISLDFVSTLLPPTTQISFSGEISGEAGIKRAFDTPIIEADVSAESFSFNDAYLGKLKARSWWDNETTSIDFAGEVTSDAQNIVAKIDGGYFIPNDSLDLIGHAEHLDIKFIEPFMANILQNIEGTASGDVHVYGQTRAKTITVTVEAMAENAQASIDFLGATFFFNDSIVLTPTEIILKEIDVLDTEGNHATLNGSIKHQYFQNLDYRIDINCNNFKALNTTAKDNDLFYGTAYATGLAVITGDDKHTNIVVNATTEKGTKLVVPIGASVATENTFITFVSDKKETTQKSVIDPFAQPEDDGENELTLNLMVNVTPQAEVQIYIDPKAGDVLKATGDGDIRIEYNDNTGDFNMYGNYEIEQGSYLFSFQEAIRKEFKVKQGGTVNWSGDPINPRINIDGYYQLNASLLDILDQSYLESSNRTTVPVQCLLNLTGNLSNPTIKFGIDLPNSDEELNRALQATISTEEMMTREIIYLLVVGKFFTPETIKNTGTVFSQNDLLAVASSTVSAQLNNWASQMFENWNFGVNFRSTDLGDSYSNEYEFNFLYTPNNRISINGNVGYRDDNLSASKFIGDFDFEYKLIQSGKLSAKAYTHTNDYNEFKTALTTQGIGLVYRENFDSGKDLVESWKTSIAESKKERAERKAKREQRRAERKAAKEKAKQEKAETSTDSSNK